ncbi:MAG: GIY-YIG nuclease family protein [Patescibacteria group bacterium]|nr:GIY-YIG nuclease family protein [Patescibacteria group bacterium]MCL5431853.1 GIY-YIG nuclease family protein [Patescibacteria group bacterium]
MPGVYFFKNRAGQIIYIGKAKSLRDRVSSYFTSPDLLPRTKLLVSEIAEIDHVVTQSEIDALILEANLIRKFAPRYNVNWKDGKAYPLIEITIKDKVPLVRLVRHETNPKARYFGPYPAGTDVVQMLRFLRRIFPFVSQKHLAGQVCLRAHLGLCPCQDLSKYPKSIKLLISVLRGQRASMQKNLQKQMAAAAKVNNFEEAAKIKAQLEKLAWLTAPRTPSWEYETNPNLTFDRQQAALSDLQHLLGLPVLRKVECYDISNTSGQSATGGQVTFTFGQPEKSLYRRYKIRRAAAPNDVAMMKEMLSRRLKSKVALPDLIVIDGGKEHLFPLPVPVIGLAKRLEMIYLVNGKTIQLPSNSPALQLLEQMRDEAHRFSRRYHFYLRSKKMLE